MINNKLVRHQVVQQLEKKGIHPSLAQDFKEILENDKEVMGRVDVMGNKYHLFCYSKSEGSIGDFLTYNSKTNQFLCCLMFSKYGRPK
jgi:hypothetical protein